MYTPTTEFGACRWLEECTIYTPSLDFFFIRGCVYSLDEASQAQRMPKRVGLGTRAQRAVLAF